MRVVVDLLATLVEYRDLLDRQKVVYSLLLDSNYRMATLTLESREWFGG